MLFSIIIPTYNRADKIDKAIESVLNQVHDDYELIIIDDGSTDNTNEVVNRYKDSRIFYFWQENKERNIARNIGIKKANGDYISFLDSDDILYSNHLSNACSMIIKNSYPEIVHLNFEYKNGRTIPSPIVKAHQNNANKKLINENMLSGNSIFIKNQVIKSCQFINSNNAVVGEDHYLWLRLAARYKIHLSIEVTNAVTVHNDRSLYNIDVEKLIKGTIEIHNSLKNDKVFLNYYSWKAWKYFANRYIFLALHLALNKRKLESLNYLLRAIQIFPLCLLSKQFGAVVKSIIIT